MIWHWTIAAFFASWAVCFGQIEVEPSPIAESVTQAKPSPAAPDSETGPSPPAEQPPAEQPPAEQPPAEQPAAEQPAAEQPGTEQPPAEPGVGPEGGPDNPITGPRDLLDRFGIDDSQFERLSDYQAFNAGDEETMLRIMYRLDRFRQVDIERWAEPKFPVAEVFAAPTEARGELFWLAGRVTAIEKVELVPEVAERFEMPSYYRCTLQMEPQNQTAQLFVRDVPLDWKVHEGELNERATSYGIFLKVAGETAEKALPVFVTPHIAWYPPTPLGDLRMDVSLLEDVQNRRPLTGKDREAFYQLLAAAGRAKPGELRNLAKQRLAKAHSSVAWTDRQGRHRWSVVPLFNEAERQHGVLVEFEGTARRAERIEVRDPDIVARLGIDHYYQIALYPPDSQGNPLWFCVREIPDGMPLGADAQYAEHVRVAGFFFKTWAYRRGRYPEEISEGEQGPWQLAPLLIGKEAVWYPPATSVMNPRIGIIAGGLFVLTLACVWVAMWRYSRGDQEFHRRTIAKEYAVQPGVSLDEMGFEASSGPDFSYLEGEAADEAPPRSVVAENDEDSR